MVQDSWNCNGNAGADHQSFSTAHESRQSPHDDHLHQLAKIKEEQSFPKFTEMLNSPSSNNMDDYYFLSQLMKNDHRDLNELIREKLLLKTTLSSSCQINGRRISTGDYFSCNNNHGRGQFSQIYPSINISNLNQSSSSSSFRALDHQNLNDNLHSSFGLDRMQQPYNKLPCAVHRKVVSILYLLLHMHGIAKHTHTHTLMWICIYFS